MEVHLETNSQANEENAAETSKVEVVTSGAREDAAARASSSPRVEHMRRLASAAYGVKDTGQLLVVWGAFERWARDILVMLPADADLPSWQEMALDFEKALGPVDAKRSGAARLLAAELLNAIAMIERNPADQVARRSTAQRLLRALAALGGTGCRLADVRAKSGLGQSHFSNILKPLVAHRLVTVEAAPTDSRGKLLSLTRWGLAAVEAEAGAEIETYRDHIEREPRHGPEFRHVTGLTRRRAQTETGQPRFRRTLERSS